MKTSALTTKTKLLERDPNELEVGGKIIFRVTETVAIGIEKSPAGNPNF